MQLWRKIAMAHSKSTSYHLKNMNKQNIYGPVNLSLDTLSYFQWLCDLKWDSRLKDATKKLPKLLKEEIESLVEIWTESYSLRFLIEYSGKGLKTHSRLGDFESGSCFELDEPDAENRRQWTIINNPIDDRILAMQNNQKNTVQVFDPETTVRPYTDDLGCFLTPEELHQIDRNNQEYSDAMNAISLQVENYLKSLGKEPVMEYSAYPHDNNGNPVNNLDQVVVHGKAYFIDGVYEVVVENPTWLELCSHFNDCVVLNQDYHHIFLEGVDNTGRTKNDLPVFGFSTGS